jgi:hypothetical protein
MYSILGIFIFQIIYVAVLGLRCDDSYGEITKTESDILTMTELFIIATLGAAVFINWH